MGNGTKNVRFSDLLEVRITETVRQKFLHEKISTDVLKRIRDEVRLQIDNVFLASQSQLTQEARHWLANQFFKSMSINGGTIGDHIVINEYNLAELPYHDIQLLRNLFDHTAIGHVIEEEYQRRTMS